jgi:uncharacterized repeat protein (TIGR01451 family)
MKSIIRAALFVGINAALFALALAGFGGFAPAQAQQETLSGVLSVTYGDHPTDPVILITLTTADGRRISLDVPPEVMGAAGGITALMGVRAEVTVFGGADGIAADTPRTASAISILSAPLNSPLSTTPPGADAPSLTGSHTWLNLLCRYSGDASEPFTTSQVQGFFANSFPYADHYWRDNALNQVTITAVTSPWRTIARTRAQILALSSNPNVYLTELFNDCTAAHTSFYTYSSYTGINMFFNNELDGSYWGGSCTFVTLQSVTQCWRSTWLPYYGGADIGIYHHEMGHAYGLPHSNNSDNDSNPYDGAFDVMSGGACVTVGAVSCVATNTIAPHKRSLGYYTSGQQFTLNTNGTFNITLDAVSEPVGTGRYGIAIFPLSGGNYISMEARRRDLSQYEAAAPMNGVVLFDYNTSRNEPAWQINAISDGMSRSGPGVFETGERYRDFVNNFSITVGAQSAAGYNVTLFRGSLGTSPDLQVTVPTIQNSTGKSVATVRVRNAGGTTAQNAFLLVRGSSSLSVNTAMLPEGCTGTTEGVVCELGNLIPGVSVERQITLHPLNSSATSTNAVSIANERETSTSNNTGTISVPATTPLADLNVTITQNVTQVNVGGQVQYIATLQNMGGANASSITFDLTAESGSSFVSGAWNWNVSPAPSCAFQTATLFRCTISTLNGNSAAGRFVRVTLNTTRASAGARTFTASATMSQTDATPADNTATASTAWGSAATLDASMTFPGRPSPNARLVATMPLRVTHQTTGLMNFPATVTTSTSAAFSLAGFATGNTYSIRIKPPGALAESRDVTVSTASPSVSFGTLRMGDANNDNVVNINDFSIMASGFGKASSADDFDVRVDFNNDGAIDLNDFTLLANSFGQAGAP